jgi:hypothetical protein
MVKLKLIGFNNESLFNNASFLKRRNIRFFRLKERAAFKLKPEDCRSIVALKFDRRKLE